MNDGGHFEWSILNDPRGCRGGTSHQSVTLSPLALARALEPFNNNKPTLLDLSDFSAREGGAIKK